MRVLLLNGRISDRGGADRWLLGVAARLRDRVSVVIAAERIDIDDARLGEVLRVRGLDRRGLRTRGRQAAVRALSALITEARPDVIHANNLVDPALLDVIARTGRGVLTVQDHRFFCPGPGKLLPDGQRCLTRMGPACAACFDDAGYQARVLRLTRERAQAAARMARVTVLSRYMAAELAAVGVAEAVVIPPFVDDLPPLPGARPRWHLFAGRLAAHKGVSVALQAAGRLRGLPLLVAGDGPMAQTVRDSGVESAGWCDRARMSALLSQAASLWLPSLWAEPFGIVGIEALYRGVPVIASDVGGVAEWAGEGVRLVPPGDPAALATAAMEVESRPPDATRLSARVQREYDPDALMDRLLAVYRAVSG